jgi:hypothetical protein
VATSCTSEPTRGIKPRPRETAVGVRAFYPASYSNSWLVAVGIDEYRHAPALRNAVKDTRSTAEMFRTLGFQTEVILNGEATKRRIIDALESRLRMAGPNDRVVFFFAGHGVDATDRDGRVEGFLIPCDGNEADRATLVPMRWLQVDLLSDPGVEAKHILYIVDACSSGVIASRATVQIDPTVRDYVSELLRRSSRQVITAGTGDQQVLDGGYGGHSIFTGLIVQGIGERSADLNADYHVTATELGLFLSERVFLQSKGAQKPDYARLLGSKGGEMVLRFPTGEEQKLLAQTRDRPMPLAGDLSLSIQPAMSRVSVMDAGGTIVLSRRTRDGLFEARLPSGDYVVEIEAGEGSYYPAKILVGVYGEVKRKVSLLHKTRRIPVLL